MWVLNRQFHRLTVKLGHHHPVLYFSTQLTKKYSTALC